MIARQNQSAGQPAGYLNPTSYGLQQGLRDIVRGNHGDCAAAQGWDACPGLGGPDGAALAAALAATGGPASGPARR